MWNKINIFKKFISFGGKCQNTSYLQRRRAGWIGSRADSPAKTPYCALKTQMSVSRALGKESRAAWPAVLGQARGVGRQGMGCTSSLQW